MGALIKKELLDRLLSIQFLVLTIVSIFLFAGNGLVFVRHYRQENASYRQAVDRNDQELSTVSTALYKQPNPLHFAADGGDRYRPAGYRLNPGGFLQALPVASANYRMPDVPELDWAFIIRIVFSLFAILLSFYAVSEEKELGTLRLILSNPVGRAELLTSKFTAIVLMVLAPLVCGILVSLIVAGAYEPQVLIPANLARIFLVLPLTLFFLSLFVFLSLCVSALVPRSSLALLVLLAVWVVFGIVIPNTSGILAERLTGAPSEYQMARMVGPLIQKEVFDRVKAILKRGEEGEISEAEMNRLADEAYADGQKQLIRHFENYEASMKGRMRLSRALSRLSPMGLFQYALEDVVSTGATGEEAFLRSARNYSSLYDEYVLKKVGRLVGTSNFSFAVSSRVDGKIIRLSSPSPQEYQGDKSDFPRFHEGGLTLGQGLRSALLDMAGLLIWVMILAVLAFLSFLRADVR